MIVARLCDTKQTSRRSRAGEWASWKGRVDISCTNHGIAPESAKIKLAVIAVLKETVVRTFRQPLSCSIFWSPILTLLLLHLPFLMMINLDAIIAYQPPLPPKPSKPPKSSKIAPLPSKCLPLIHPLPPKPD